MVKTHGKVWDKGNRSVSDSRDVDGFDAELLHLDLEASDEGMMSSWTDNHPVVERCRDKVVVQMRTGGSGRVTTSNGEVDACTDELTVTLTLRTIKSIALSWVDLLGKKPRADGALTLPTT